MNMWMLCILFFTSIDQNTFTKLLYSTKERTNFKVLPLPLNPPKDENHTPRVNKKVRIIARTYPFFSPEISPGWSGGWFSDLVPAMQDSNYGSRLRQLLSDGEELYLRIIGSRQIDW